MTEQDRPAPDSASGDAVTTSSGGVGSAPPADSEPRFAPPASTTPQPPAPGTSPASGTASERDPWLAPASSGPAAPAPAPATQLVPAYAPAAGAGAPPYGPPAGAGPVYAQPVYAVAPPTNGLAIASLICGLAGLLWVTSFIASPLSIIFGFMSLSKIKRTGEGGKGMAIAGIIIGFALIVPAVIAVVVAIGWIIVALGIAGAGAASYR